MAKTIQISYTRKITVHKTVMVTDKEAKRALALDGKDMEEPMEWSSDKPCDWSFITEELTDSYHDIMDMDREIEDLSVTIVKNKKKK